MDIEYVSLKCPMCGNTTNWYHDVARDAYECLHCGTITQRVEKKEQAAASNNIVRQVLRDIAHGRMDSARRNLQECEAIDPQYIGTIIATLAYEMYRLREELSPAEKRGAMSQMKACFLRLCAGGPMPDTDENTVYKALQSAEAIGVLVLVYDNLNLTARRDSLLARLNATEIYSASLHADLLRFAAQNERYEMLDTLSSYAAGMDSSGTVQTMLLQYPDGDQKRENLQILLTQGHWTEEDRRLFTRYFEESADAVATLFTVATAIAAKPCCPSMDCLVPRVLMRAESDAQVCSLADALTAREMLDTERYALLTFALENASDTACLHVLRQFAKTGHYLEFMPAHFEKMLSRRTSVDVKKQLVEAALAFSVRENQKERFIASYLCDIQDDPAVRSELLEYLFTLVPTLSSATVSAYLMKDGIDGDNKATIVQKIFAMKINRSLYRDVLSEYVRRSGDAPTVKSRVLQIMVDAGLPLSQEASTVMLLGNGTVEEMRRLIKRLADSGMNMSEVAKGYMAACNVNTFRQDVWKELLTQTKSFDEITLVKYVLMMRAPVTAKTETATAMMKGCFNPPSHITCKVRHNNNTVACNLLQGYILVAAEPSNEAASILRTLGGVHPDLGADVTVNGQTVKFKKYLALQRKALQPTTETLCAQQHLL